MDSLSRIVLFEKFENTLPFYQLFGLVCDLSAQLKSAAISSALPCSSNGHILSWNMFRTACGLGDSSLLSLWFCRVICDCL
jgi:hypothetical protein